MKKLFFLVVLLGTCILAGIFVFSHWRLQTKTPDAYFQLGKKYYEQGRFSEAQIEFLNALKRDGSHRDSRYYLALNYLAQQDPNSGVQQLRALLEAYPDDVEANLDMGSVYIQVGKSDPKYYQDAIDTAETVLKKEPNNLRARILKGNALGGQALADQAPAAKEKKFSEAVEAMEGAIALEPKNVSAWIALGSVRVWEKDFPEAEKAFLGAREADPKDKIAFTSLANFYQVAGKPDKAELIFTEALSQFPGEQSVYSQATEFYLKSGRLGDVERVLKTSQATNSKDPTPTIYLAEVYSQRNRKSDALALLQDAKTRFPDSIPLAIKLAEFLIPQKPDQARREIDRILNANKNDPQGQLLLGELEFSTGHFPEAAKALTSNPALGRSFPQVHYLLGDMALKAGRFDEAQDHFRQALRVNKTYLPTLIGIANGYLAQGNIPEARQQVRQILEMYPENVSGRLLKARVDGFEKKDSAAEAEFSSLLREYPDNPEIHRQIGMYWSSRDKNAAENSFVRALELEPGDQNINNLISLYINTNQTARAREKLSAVPDTQKAALHFELLGRIAEQERNPQEAEAAYKRALEKEANRSNTEMLLFNLYLGSGRKDDAIRLLDDLAKRTPSNASIFAMKAAVEKTQGNLAEAEVNYRKALEIDPTLDFAANNLAYLLVQDERDLQTAQTLAEGVRRRQPENPGVADTLGWIYFKKGLLVLARAQAQFAVDREPNNGVFQYHLGKIYMDIYRESKESSQRVKAVEALKKAAGSSAEFPERELAKADLQELQKPKL